MTVSSEVREPNPGRAGVPPGSPVRFARAALLASVAFLTLTAAIGVLDVRYWRQGKAAALWVEHTSQVLATLYRVRWEVTDLESRERAFLLTFDPADLDPHGASAQRLNEDVAAIGQLVADSPLQRIRTARLSELISLTLRALDDEVQLARNVGQDAARTAFGSRHHHHRLDEIRSQVETMLGTERDLLAQRQAQEVAMQQWTAWMALAAILLAASAAALAATYATREISQRRRALNQIAQLRDLAERRAGELQATAAALRAARDEADRANQAKSRFLAAAGHDLRQALQLIMLALGALADRAGPAGAQEARRGEAAIAKLDRAFSQFSQVARLSSGRMPADPRAIDIGPLLAELCDELQPLARQKGLRLRHVASTARVRSDPTMLATIMRNLIGNAIKYTDHGGVLVGVQRRGSRVLARVCDTGIGIARDSQDAIFDEFRQLTPGSNDGVGLGLNIVKRTALLLGHDIAVRSTPGRGSCFSVALPAVPAVATVGIGDPAHA